jgi:hypothetical protein
MIERIIHRIELELRLSEYPAVVLLGPRQVGKTTLALEISKNRTSQYLDLELPSDRTKLIDPELYLGRLEKELIILDEIQRVPELFPTLRSIIDRRRRMGRKTGQFLLLGSASMDLLRQSSESLAGRITYYELSGFGIEEYSSIEDLWLRGGFPESVLSSTDESSFRWRGNFIRTYLERDIPAIGPRIASETLRRFWTMLAHHQGGIHNSSRLARSLGLSSKTISSYLDLFVDLLLVRRISPWQRNVGKRLVKSPKVIIRDSGLLHQLLGITEMDALLGHPVVGASWEGFVLENIIQVLPDGMEHYFYRTGAGAEIDLVLVSEGNAPIAIEVKRSLSPKVPRGFRIGCQDIQARAAYIVYPGETVFPLDEMTTAIPLPALIGEIRKMNKAEGPFLSGG